MAKQSDDLGGTKRLMGALVRMKPKPHEEMKIGKGARKKSRGPSSKKKELGFEGLVRPRLGPL
jgi:hypothetical protein